MPEGVSSHPENIWNQLHKHILLALSHQTIKSGSK